MSADNRSGIALVTVLCFTLLVSGLLAILVRAAGTRLRVARSQAYLEQALFTAEGGAERGASYLANGGEVPMVLSGTIGDGSYSVMITVVTTYLGGSGGASGGGASGSTIGGSININPNNSPDNEFVLTLEGGGTITRDDLHASHSGYTGGATLVHVKPKGNGNQNALTVDGSVYPLQNSTTYDISSSSMDVDLYNDHINPNGRAVGKWWISIAASEATVSP